MELDNLFYEASKEDMTELDEYQDFVANCPQPTPEDIVSTNPETLKGWWAASQMSCEAEEVLEIFEKAVRKGKDVDIEKVMDECGDVLWGLTCVCNTFGIALDEVIEHNVNKLNERHNEKIHNL